MFTQTLSLSAAASLSAAIKESGLTETGNDRYDGVTLKGTMEQWANLGEATIALYQRESGTERVVLNHAAQRNPAIAAVVCAFAGYGLNRARLARIAARKARRAARLGN
jgi:hypothetical protein